MMYLNVCYAIKSECQTIISKFKSADLLKVEKKSGRSRYNHLDSLRKHNKRRLKNKCEVCSRVFCAALKFQEHKRVDRCGLSAFDDQNNSMEIESNELTADQSNEDKRKTVTEEKTRQMDNNPHKCLVCDKTFKRRWYLTEHMRTHSDARDFECVHCHQK